MDGEGGTGVSHWTNCSNTRTHQVYCGRGGRDWSQSLDELLEHAHTPGVLWTGRAGPESVTGRTARTRAHTRCTVDGDGGTGVSHWVNCSNTRTHQVYCGRGGRDRSQSTGRTARTRAHTRCTVDGEGGTGVSQWTNCSNTRTHQVYCGRGGRDRSQSLDELLEHAHTPGVLWTGRARPESVTG